MVYPHKWSPISYRSSAGERKHAGQRPMFYRWTTQPTYNVLIAQKWHLFDTNVSADLKLDGGLTTLTDENIKLAEELASSQKNTPKTRIAAQKGTSD